MKDDLSPAIADAASDAVRSRLREALGDALTPTGTPVAEALHHLFLSEARQRGGDRAVRAWTSLTAAEIDGIAQRVVKAVWGFGSATFDLPAGTEVIGAMTGCALVGGETAGFDVDRPGVHPVEDLPFAPGGSNLALLLSVIDELGRGLPFGGLGTPTVVERYEGDRPSHRLHFPPFAQAGGVVLQRSMDLASMGEFFCAYTEEMVRDLATAIAVDMCALWNDHVEIGERARRARRDAERVAARLDGVHFRGVTAKYGERRGCHYFELAVEFDAVDHALRRGIVVREVIQDAAADTGMPARLDRAAEAAHLASLGADGRIEGLAHAIAQAAPQGAAAVLAELGERFEARVDLPLETGTQEFRLHWRDGVIRASSPSHSRVSIYEGRVTLWWRTIPDTIAVALRGRPLHALFDQPFRCDAVIRSAVNQGDRIELEIEPDFRLVDCRSGRAWREGEPDAASRA